MEGQRKQVSILAAAEVTAALVDLGRLSQQIGLAAPNKSAAIAKTLLERIMALCEAQQGALLLVIDNPPGDKLSFALSVFNKRAMRIFALSAMNEGEALTKMDSYATNGADLQTLPHEPCWVMCKLPISSLSSSQVSSSPERSAASSLTVLTSSQPALPLYALLLLGWAGKEESSRLAKAERGRSILPLVVDVAGTVLANILLSEQVHELEASINRQALREMELLKAELLATVSHELRSPLASIKGYAATLLRHEQRISREERREFLLAINESSDRLAVVIDRLLEMSQLETGTITINRASVNPVHLVREALIAIGQRVKEKEHIVSVAQGLQDTSQAPERITFSMHLEDQQGMPTTDEPIIQADRFRLREVLDSLLENAINYSPEGGKIEVILRPIHVTHHAGARQHLPGTESQRSNKADVVSLLPEGQEMLEICVRDSGIGIPREHIGRIFDHFHRVDTRLTREVNGLGLGLAICKRIVELHDGVIWVESEVGKGSAFHVWLPLDAP